jgi:hypothetical protein
MATTTQQPIMASVADVDHGKEALTATSSQP